MEPSELWESWDPVMQEDYLASLDLTIGDELVLEVRRKVLDSNPSGVNPPRS